VEVGEGGNEGAGKQGSGASSAAPDYATLGAGAIVLAAAAILAFYLLKGKKGKKE